MTGNRIKSRLGALGYQYTEVAQAMGISKQNLYGCLRSENVSSRVIERIADALGIRVSVLYGEGELMNIDDYAELHTLRRENELLKQLLAEKDAHLNSLKR